MEKLENSELLDQAPGSNAVSQEEIRKNQSFTESLVTKVIDNLQVTIQNIHIRYEDESSVPGHPFSIGFTLEELSAISTNDSWDPSFIQVSTQITHKLATLSSLSIYWNTDSTFIKSYEPDELLETFRSLIAGSDNDLSKSTQYILRPVSGQGRITLNKGNPTPTSPKTHAQLLFDDLDFVFDSDQYRDALWTAELFRLYIKTRDFKKYRPQVEVKKDPRAWLKFAGTVVLNEIHRKHEEWSWDYIKARRDKRLKYIELFKKKISTPPLSPEDTTEIDALEWELSYDDLKFYRSLAKSELRKEKAKLKPLDLLKPKPAASTWGSWIWGSSATTTESSETDLDKDMAMTEEQRKELYEAIEWDEKQALATSIDLPQDIVVMRIDSALRSGSFTLRRDPHGKSQDFALLSCHGFRASICKRPDSILATMSLKELAVDDGTEGSLYKQVVTVKPLEDDVIAAALKDTDDDGDNYDINAGDSSEQKNSLFWLRFEQNPLDQSADSSLNVKLKSITVFYNHLFIEEVVRFFKPPKTHLETIGAIMNAAGATVEGIRDQTRIGLEYALQEHKTINIKLDLQAPLIVIPLDVTSWSSPCAIIDAGHISVVSDLVGKEVIESINRKNTHQYTEQDWKQLESLMYDKFNLKLHDTQIILGASVRETMRQLHNEEVDQSCYIIDRINLDFQVEISIVPDAHSLTKFKVSGHLPIFRASMSDAKYKLMMNIIDQLIPNLDFDDGEPVEDNSIIASNPGFSLLESGNSYHVLEDSDTETLTDTSSSVKTGSDSQRVFEFSFHVDKVEMSLHRCTDTSTLAQEPLIDMVLESFELDYYYMPKEMGADVILKKLNIEDYIEKDSPVELHRIATSNFPVDDRGEEGSSSGPSHTDELFKVRYKRTKRDEDISDQDIQVSLSALRFVVNPKSFLTILDFIITTFTDPSNSSSPEPDAIGDKADSESSSVASVDVETPAGNTTAQLASEAAACINVQVKLHEIMLILNDDGIQLATLKLDSATVNVLLVAETLKIAASVGSVTLHDDVNEGSKEGSVLRQIISIEDKEELADFRYETFDPRTNTNAYNASIYFRAGSIKINVVDEPLARIFQFLARFAKMKTLYDSARQAALNQANQIGDASKIHFDVIIKTPILVFPKLIGIAQTDASYGQSEGICDVITAHLGEIYLVNKFDPVDEVTGAGVFANSISAGIRATRLGSNFYFKDGTSQILEIIDNIDLSFEISYVEPFEGMERPLMTISGQLSDIKLKLTELQFRYLLELSRSVPGIFATDSDLEEEKLDEIEHELMQTKHLDEQEARGRIVGANRKALEINSVANTNLDKINFAFHMDTFSLTLYRNTANIPAEEIESKSLSRFSLNDSGIKLRIKNDGSIDSDVHVRSFTVHDTREVKDNKFSEIIPRADHSEYQFMGKFSMSGDSSDSKSIYILLTVDSPRVILALDYWFAVKGFVDYGLTVLNEVQHDSNNTVSGIDKTLFDDDDDDENDGDEIEEPKPSSQSLSYHINIVDASVILIANPQLADSEAIVFKAEQFTLTQQTSTTLSASKVGMFLCKMNKFNENRLRILDDFSSTISVDSRGSDASHHLMAVHIAVEPLVLRLSLRDILLAVDIFKKASALSESESIDVASKEVPQYSRFSQQKKLIRNSTRSKHRSRANTYSRHGSVGSFGRRSTISGNNAESISIIHGEELSAEFEGLRFVVIGQVHELPMLDMCTKSFTVTARNWSSDLNVDMSLETFINIYNFSKSAWEPLIEPWDLGFHVSNALEGDHKSISLFSRQTMELTVTSRSIGLITTAIDYMSTDKDDDFLTKPRDEEAPYRITNQTGYAIEIWIDGDTVTAGSEPVDIKTIPDGQEIPWRFYNWTTVRENLSTDSQRVYLGVRLKDSPYDPIRNISVTSEGEHLHTLYPKTQKISHRLVCEVTLMETVKSIVIRSPLVIDNQTNIPIEIAVRPSDDESADYQYQQWIIEPCKSRAIPLPIVYQRPIRVRPHKKFGFRWARDPIVWRHFLNSSQSIPCRPENPANPAASASTEPTHIPDGTSSETPFYFQADAQYDTTAPLPRVYPYMRIILSAPIEIVNLLPFDFTYRIYDKNTKKDWTNFLKKGSYSPVHVVQLSHLLLLSVHPKDAGYDRTDFAIINSNTKGDDFRRETGLTTRSPDGQRLLLKVHYHQNPGSGSGYQVMIYTPYLILNQTGLDVQIRTRFNTATSKVSNVTSLVEGQNGFIKRATPKMWSFDSDDRGNRATLRVGDSKWSVPQSFDAIGSDAAVVMPASRGQNEIHVGLHISNGEGVVRTSVLFLISDSISNLV